LQAAGVEVLFDDRNERPGVKFMDADLIGLPLRVTVGDKSLNKGGAELKRRNNKESVVVALSELVERVRIEIRDLQAEIATRVMEVPFKD
jgi:prolyl-tRNA synthetase